ncbi:hypothetical protein LDENG_00086850 [Lucifuga dentata]|nr:hypothetical protein LDENG_00086850 [Lucifuga dentata]
MSLSILDSKYYLKLTRLLRIVCKSKKMSTAFSFQSQLVSIMDALSKAAVLEISKLVEIESKMLKIEITRGRDEIASLTEKLQLMEKLLYMAQGHRQDAAGHSVTSMEEDGAENSFAILEPDRIRRVIKGESPWENINSSTELKSLHQVEEPAAVEMPNPGKEQPEMMVVKEELSEVEIGDNSTEQEMFSEKRSEMVRETQKRSSDMIQSPKPISTRQQPMFTESFGILNSQSSTAGPMMCDNTNRNFRTQLAAILEKLTKAALAEISSLADECSSVLHGEISQHKTENEALKKRCYTLELQLRAARETHSYPPNVNCVSRRQHAEQQQAPAPAIQGVYGKDWCMNLWREDKLLPQRKEVVEPPAMRNIGPPVIDLMDREPDLIFVKEEMYEDQPTEQMRLTDNRKSVGIFEEDSSILHQSVDELQLHSGELSNFAMTADNQSQQSTQPTIMDKIIEDATLSTLVENADPPAASGGYSDYTNSIHMTEAKELIVQPKPVKPLKQFECLFCGKVFNYLSSLKVHVRRHSA